MTLPDALLERLLDILKHTTVGPGTDPMTQMGPLVSPQHLERVLGYVELGLQEGAVLAHGGRRLGGPLADGLFLEPTIFTAVDNQMRIAQEEIFGPVLAVIPFRDEQDVVTKANQSRYGLAAGVWTKDIARGHRLAQSIRAGTIYLNCYNMFDPCMPWGGFKASGWAREHGSYVLDQYTEVKAVWSSLD